ncbi:MAG: hypothetical protein CM1200mP13_11100 [Candidatus Pelagibacterales bacterium]|nr:MAG: hypothetical protein CM1200mP13_11100 [Pelagibacterales bacterium]
MHIVKINQLKMSLLKKNERIKTIETEIESWKNLLTNSEKMVNELTKEKKNYQNN